MAKEKPKAEGMVRNICRKKRKQYNAEEKIRIVIEGLRGFVTMIAGWQVVREELSRLWQELNRRHCNSRGRILIEFQKNQIW